MSGFSPLSLHILKPEALLVGDALISEEEQEGGGGGVMMYLISFYLYLC